MALAAAAFWAFVIDNSESGFQWLTLQELLHAFLADNPLYWLTKPSPRIFVEYAKSLISTVSCFDAGVLSLLSSWHKSFGGE